MAGIALTAGALLSGCSKIKAIVEFEPNSVAILEARITVNDFQISMLQDRLKVLETDRGDWILWRTIYSVLGPGVVAAGPPMPFAISAFSHHAECTDQAKSWATRDTPSKSIGVAEPFVASFDNGTQKTYQCFPKGVKPGFATQ